MPSRFESIVDAKGELIVARDDNLVEAFPAGTDGQILTADSAANTGIAWSDSAASMSFVVDEDDMVSDSDTKVPTQQSVKAYVDGLSGTYASLSALDSTASIEELVGSSQLTESVSGSLSYHAFVAPFALTIEAFSVVTTGGQTASDTNYWTVQLRRFRAGSSVLIAEKAYTVAGGNLSSNSDNNFDAVTFDEDNQDFAKGDILNVNFIKTGTPSNLGRTSVTWRYVPT